MQGVRDKKKLKQILQIAGRAGRYGSKAGKGSVTTLHPEDLGAVHAAFQGRNYEKSVFMIFYSTNVLEQ
jgi:hypothetical protein